MNSTITITNIGRRQFTYKVKIPLKGGGIAEYSKTAMSGEPIEIPTEDELLPDEFPGTTGTVEDGVGEPEEPPEEGVVEAVDKP